MIKNTDHTPFNVKYKAHITETSDPSDENNAVDTYTDYSISHIEIGKEETYDFNCLGHFKQINDNPIFLVYLIYSTGDSFSRQENGGITFIEIFKTEEKAELCKKMIENHHNLIKLCEANPYYKSEITDEILSFTQKYYNPKATKNDIKNNKIFTNEMLKYQVKYLDEIGEEKITHADWIGYFEELSSVNVEKFIPILPKLKKYKI